MHPNIKDPKPTVSTQSNTTDTERTGEFVQPVLVFKKRVVAFTHRVVLDSTCQKWLKTLEGQSCVKSHADARSTANQNAPTEWRSSVEALFANSKRMVPADFHDGST